jgi:hypothetical protein
VPRLNAGQYHLQFTIVSVQRLLELLEPEVKVL